MNEQNVMAETQLEEKDLILLVDDDPLIVESLGFMLRKHFEVMIADSRQAAIDVLATQHRTPALALVDLGLPPKAHSPEEGFALIGDLLAQNNNIKTLVSGQDEDVNIQHALTLGAVDFIAKPADPALLLARLQHHTRLRQVELQSSAKNTFHIIGDSIAMDMVHKQIKQFADSPFPVLIEGESGTGKEMIARAIHQHSEHADQPYLAINCAAFTPELLESQLFGHRKGAFTGAVENSEGFFSDAGKGTLLLDEIGELPTSLQVKLLRVLENGEYYRIGETKLLQSQARIIAATNKKLSDEIAAGTFRTDLYHRLGILNITLPPLRERGNDVYLLMNYFQDEYADSVSPFTLDNDALKLWGNYDFPGNVRELRNIVIRLGTKYPGAIVTAAQLEAELETRLSSSALGQKQSGLGDDAQIKQKMLNDDFYLDDVVGEIESRCIKLALEMNNNNVSRAAEALHINRTTLYSRVQKLGKE
jgi:two-component system nitrogen regulation response regulator GlnG